MKITLAKNIGFCFGVKRAVNLTYQALKNNPGKPVYSFGALIHNPPAVKKMKEMGVKVVHSLKDVAFGGILVIPSHGLASLGKEAQRKKLKIIDATCPYVLRNQRLALSMAKEGYKVVIIGKKTHPEIKGIMGWVKDRGLVVGDPEDVEHFPKTDKIAVIVQTTESLVKFKDIALRMIDKGFEIKIYNTLCVHTLKRQKEVKNLAKKNDVIIVVGGHNSSNTRRLFEIAGSLAKTHQIESSHELMKGWFRGRKNIGLVSGTSAPLSAVKEVAKKIKTFTN